MSKVTFFTPTYRDDAERFRLLLDSVLRFYDGDFRYVIAVPKEDVWMFRNIIRGTGVEIVVQNDFVDKKFYPSAVYSLLKRVAPGQAWRFERFGGRNGWIKHIIVKLSLPKFVERGAAVLLDSDSFFTRPFSDSDLDFPRERRILVKWVPRDPLPAQQRHLQKTRLILGAPEATLMHNYQSNPEIWYPDWVISLQKHLEGRYNMSWQDALFDAGAISSSALYGTYVEEVLKPAGLKIRPPFGYYIAWDEQSYWSFVSDPKGSIGDNFYAVIQSNLGHPVGEYRDSVVNEIFNKYE